MVERLQKIIAIAGIASRRAAEGLILEGRVRVNGKVVTEMGFKADPDKDHIKVDGKLINPLQPKVYLMLNKPEGYVTTLADPEGRKTVMELIGKVKARVFPVGRLDYNTEGLLLLTNDGDFAHHIMHPSHELPKTYLAKIKGSLTDGETAMLEQGVFLRDGKTAPARIKRLRKEEVNSWVEVTIHEGRKRQVRRMFDHVNHSVIKLRRVKVGNLQLGDLPPGALRHLGADEVTALRDMSRGTGQPEPAEAPALPVRKPAADWKRMEVGTIPGPKAKGPKRSTEPGTDRPRAMMRGREASRGIRQQEAGGRTGAGRKLWSAQDRYRASSRPGGKQPWQGGAGTGRSTGGASDRPAAGRVSRPDSVFEQRRPRGSAFTERTRRPVRQERRPESRGAWQESARTGRPSPDAERRPAPDRGPRADRGFAPRRSGGTSFVERRPFRGDRRPAGGASWQGEAGRGRTFEGTRRPFVKKGPRPAGGPGKAGVREGDRRSGAGRPRTGPQDRGGVRGAYAGGFRGTTPGTVVRRPEGQRTRQDAGQSGWSGSSGAGPRSKGRGPFSSPGRPQRGRSGTGGPGKGRQPDDRGPRRNKPKP